MKQTTLRITDASDVPITGLTGTNIKVRKSPYGGGDELAGISVSGGTNGVYLIDFGTNAYQPAQIWVDGVYQSNWGTKNIGDEVTEFLSKTSTTEQDVKSDIDMNSKKLKNLTTGSANGDSMTYGQGVKLTGDVDEEVTGIKTHKVFPKKKYSVVADLIASNNDEFITKYHIDNSSSLIGISSNILIVDSNLPADVTGKKYRVIQDAISYASSQVPSASSIWNIFIFPHKGTGYSGDVRMTRFTNLIGLGKILITGTFDSTHGISQTWTGYESSIKNLIINSTDKDCIITGLNANDCDFKVNGAGGEINLIVNSSQLRNCGLFNKASVNNEAQNGFKVNRVLTYGNVSFPWLTTDKVYSETVFASDDWEF